MSVISVVITSDSLAHREALSSILNRAQGVFTVLDAVELEQVKERAMQFQPEVILCAVKDEEISSSFVNDIKTVCPQTALVMVTEHETLEVVINAFKTGADACVGLTSPGYLMRILELVCRSGIMVFPRAIKSHILKMVTVSERLSPKMLEEMTAREKEIFNLLIAKNSNKEIARCLFISESTVKSHVRSILQKVGVKNRIDLNDSLNS
jgi:DNA-binding NarL/FixJ family response regulator